MSALPGGGDARVEMAADFARRFAEYWSAPTPARLDTLLADRVRLVADRFVLGGDGLATERVSYFDPTSIQSSSPT